MPSNQKFPNARRRWRPRGRYVLIGAVGALAVLVALTAAAPRGGTPDLGGPGTTPGAIALGPTAEPPTPTAEPPTPTAEPKTPTPEPATPTPGPPTPMATTAPTATPKPPAPTATPAPTSASPTPAPSLPSPTASASSAPGSPAPAASPSRYIGSTTGRAITASRVSPSRLGAEAAPKRAPALDLLTGYRWPVAKVRLTLPFGPTAWGSRIVDGEPFHDGIDLATFCGDRVMAAHAGRVLAAGRRFDAMMGWVGDLGPYLRRLERNHLWSTLPIVVVTDDGNGYRSMYAHFGRIVVKPGETVKAGQLLGYEGATGHASGCHVHFGLFSPWETATFAIRPDVVKRMKLPKVEIARIDPLLVLPPKPGVNAPKAPKASPSQSSTAASSASPTAAPSQPPAVSP